MIRLLLISGLLLCPAPPQDGEVKQLIRDLEADDIEVRDRAVHRLIEKGEAARAAAAALTKSKNPELAARARAILAGMKEAKRLLAVFGNPRTYTINAKDESLVEVLKRFRKDSGLAFKIRSVPGGAKVTCSIEEPTAVAALEKLCAAHGDIRVEPASLTVTRGKPGVFPFAADGRWRVYLTSISMDEYGGAWSGGWAHATISAVWDTARRPANITVEPTEIVDDSGDSMLQESHGGMLVASSMSIATLVDNETRTQSVSVSFNIPPADATWLTIRGKVHLDYEIESETLAFDNPSDDIGTSRTKDTTEVTLTDFTKTGATIRVSAAAPQGQQQTVPRIEGIGSDDKHYPFKVFSTSSSYGGTTLQRTMTGQFNLPSGVTIKRIEAIIVTRTRRISIPFEFEKVKIARPPSLP